MMLAIFTDQNCVTNSGDSRVRNLRKFLDQVDLPEILRNIALLLTDYLPAICRKTCASLSCRMTCPYRAVVYSGKKTYASFLA